MSEVERREEEEYDPEFNEELGIGRAVALVLAGIGIGAGLALLLTPKRGDEVRDAIGRGYRKTIDSLTERVQDLQDRARDLKED
ncbi:MAG TPA: YtxH domain-containing protein, partial [Candidatus Angelobacter sp.]|nr:YtxH domain-containing protein [Candidatus Angelobacter sp.]